MEANEPRQDGECHRSAIRVPVSQRTGNGPGHKRAASSDQAEGDEVWQQVMVAQAKERARKLARIAGGTIRERIGEMGCRRV